MVAPWCQRVHFEKLIDDLGIGDEVRGRGIVVDSGFTAEKLTSGEVDIAVQLVSEIMSVDGVEVAALFPAALQAPANFSVAVFAQTSNRAAGRRFVDFLTSEAAAQAYVAGGLIPAPC